VSEIEKRRRGNPVIGFRLPDKDYRWLKALEVLFELPRCEIIRRLLRSVTVEEMKEHIGK